MTKQEKNEARWLAVKSKDLCRELIQANANGRRVTKDHLAMAGVLSQDAECFAKTGKRY